jgi:hypothetical protein
MFLMFENNLCIVAVVSNKRDNIIRDSYVEVISSDLPAGMKYVLCTYLWNKNGPVDIIIQVKGVHVEMSYHPIVSHLIYFPTQYI